MRIAEENQLHDAARSISPLSVDEVGSPRWFAQQEAIELLHLESVRAQNDKDDDVVWELLTDLGKIPILVFQLLVIEKWMSDVLPGVAQKVDLQGEPGLRLRFVIQFESELAELVAIALFHRDACAALGTSASDLLRWCRRKGSMLVAIGAEEGNEVPLTPTEQDVSTSDAELASAMRLARIRSAITSLAILQYLTDFSSILPLDAVSLFSDPNFDVPVLVANLLELAPWLRASPLLPTESAANLLDQASSFTTYEAQLWLILGNLLLDPGFRQRYEIDSVRRDSIMSIGEMLGSAVLKQLPHLKKLKNIVEEVALLQVEGRKVATKPMICEITPGEQALSVAGKGGEWFEKDVAPFTGYAERYVLRMAQLY